MVPVTKTNREGEYYPLRIEACEDNKRDATVLLPFIQRNVAAGATVNTDCWGGYNRLPELGYQHQTVNHSENFIDPQSGAHTQRVESNWRPLKYFLIRHGSRNSRVPSLIKEYLWRRKLRLTGKQDVFRALMVALNESNLNVETFPQERFPEEDFSD